MRILIIDTSTEKSLVALADEAGIIRCERLASGLQCSHYLFEALESLDFKLSSIDSLAVTRGPGLFTGIRVGVSAAKGIALGSSLPLIGISSLYGFVTEEEGRFASIIEGSLGGAHILLQERREGKVWPLSSPTFISHDKLSSYLQDCPRLIGPQFRRSGLVGQEVVPDPAALLAALHEFGSPHLQLIY